MRRSRAEFAKAGHRGDDRTFFIAEGVTQYLTADAVHTTFDYLRCAAPGSRLVFAYMRRDFIGYFFATTSNPPGAI